MSNSLKQNNKLPRGYCYVCGRRTTHKDENNIFLCKGCDTVKSIDDEFNKKSTNKRNKGKKNLEQASDEYKLKYDALVNSDDYKILKQIQKAGVSPESVKSLLKASQRTNKDGSQSYNIGNNHTKMLVFGDTHIGHKMYDPKLMDLAVKEAEKQNVDMILCTGDIADGWYQNRPAAIFEQNAIGFDNQMDKSVKELTKLKKLNKPFYYITGNHEYNTFVRGAGVEFGDILKLRLDKEGMENYYMGNAEANLKLNSGTNIKVIHPDGGTAYAISYKSQKIVESLAGAGERMPDVAFIGHFHKSEYIPYQGVHTFQTGTMCGQTKFMRGKGIPAHKGFWIVDIQSKKNGRVDAITPKYYSVK